MPLHRATKYLENVIAQKEIIPPPLQVYWRFMMILAFTDKLMIKLELPFDPSETKPMLPSF